MEDSDFEEEGTHSYVSFVDPDVALSYIDEKLENLLGHFQKDFEGGVSAENLGAKFGGYGSFLSMYQRSPVCSRPKSPPQVHNQVGGPSNSPPSSAVPQVAITGSTSKAPASNVLVKLKKNVKSSNIGTPDRKLNSNTVTSCSAPSNQKTLRLRIKVGSGDLSSLKNVSTNSKQGLNMPSSTSRVNYLSEVEGLLNGICNSPTKILMAMVSFPLHKDQLLSPLSHDLIQFGKKENIMKDAGYGSVNKSDSEGTHNVLGVSDAQKCAGKFSTGKKEKLKERVKNMPPSNMIDRNHSVSNSEEEADKQSCDELVSKTLKLPLLSCLSPSYIHPAKDIDKVSDSYVEGTLRGANNTDLNAALMRSKPELDNNVVALPDQNVKETQSVSTRKDLYLKKGETLNSSESKSKREKAPNIGHVDYSSGVKVSQSETRNEKRKLKENKEIGNCVRLREATVMESSGEKVRKKKRLKDSSCDEKELPFSSESCDRDRGVSLENGRDSASHLPFTAPSLSLCKDLGSEFIKTDVHEAKGSLVESFAPSALRVLDSCELRSGRISERYGHHDTESATDDTLKRCRDGEAYSTIEKAGTTKQAAENSKDKEKTYGENCSIEKFKLKKSGRFSSEDCTEGESKRKNREEGSPAPSKDNNWTMVNEVQDLGTAVEVETKESNSKKRPARKVSLKSNKEDSREDQDPNTKLDKNGSHFPSPQKPNRAKTFRGKGNHLEVTNEKLKNKSASPADTNQVEVLGHGSEISNTKKQMLRNDNHSVTHDQGSRNQKQNGIRHKDRVGLSPLKKTSTSQAVSNSIKEATDLKHMADRLKNAGSNHESTGVYFQAALMFLHGASLLESSGSEHATHNSIARSRDIYGSTAKLCEFCAHEYEKNKDMVAAALAYKCMEVAYLRITYSSHGNISRYRFELHGALQGMPSGESPSFTSDGENSNHILAAEKVALLNTVRSSPSLTGNFVISSGNNSSLSQLLAFSQNVGLAMYASRKAQIAFAAAKGKSSDTRYSSDGIASIKRALDFNFQDMEKLLHVVRLAMESINR